MKRHLSLPAVESTTDSAKFHHMAVDSTIDSTNFEQMAVDILCTWYDRTSQMHGSST